MRRMKDEHGATAVVVALVMTMLIGFTALAVDVGALWWDKKELQNGADAAALALAEDCAQVGGQSGCADDRPMAESLVEGNWSKPATEVSILPGEAGIHLDGDSVTVTVSGSRDFWFAPILGDEFRSTAIPATATASWLGIGSAIVLPLTVSECYLQGVEWGETVRIPVKGSAEADGDTCRDENDTHWIPGGFGWLVPETSDCLVETETGYITSSLPGNSGPTGNDYRHCRPVLKDLEDTVIRVPVFDEALGTGANGTFHLSGYAELVVKAYCFNKGQDWYHEAAPPDDDPMDTCNGDNRFIRGEFRQMLDLDEVTGGENYGVTTVGLTD